MEKTGTALHPMQGNESLYTFLLSYILPNLHQLLELHEYMHEGSISKDYVLYTAILGSCGLSPISSDAVVMQ